MDENNPKILVVSDIHLGALKSNIGLLTQFLNDVINDKFGKDLQAFIILGDFLDLCISVPENLLADDEIQGILRLLQEIKKKVNLIYVLGNHEIPITSNVFTGTYDEKFEKRKTKFLNKFKNSFVEDLFPSDHICHYIILKKFENDDILLLYDSQDQIYSHPINKIKIDGINLEQDYACLMLHGYQFDSEVFRFFTGQMWKSLISYHNSEVKETFNYFWNEVVKAHRKIKLITFENMKDDLARLKNLSSESIDKLFSDLNKLEFNFIKLNMRIMKKWEHARDYSYYLTGIIDFLDEVECDFSKINHIIYGHSHVKEISNEIIDHRNVEIVNDGAWQHAQPSFVKILNKGKIEVRSLKI